MLPGTLGAIYWEIAGKGINSAGDGVIRAGLCIEIKDKVIKTKRIFNTISSFN